MIQDKEKQLTDELGRDQQAVYTLQRQHKAFEADLQPLGVQVQEKQEFANQLKPAYAGPELQVINDKEQEVVDAWKALLQRVSKRGFQLGESDEYQRLLMMVTDLLLWIQDMRMQIASDEKPKDISSCEALMDLHQQRKAEMDTKEDKFVAVFKLGEQLMEKSHYASIEIQDKLEQLKAQKTLLEGDWDLHWEELQLTLEVMQFARDAHLADEWIAQNKSNIYDRDLGGSIEEVDKMIEKHTNFERLLNKQTDRFHALERLTTFELREARQRQLEEAKREREEQERKVREEQEALEREKERERAHEEEEKRRRDEEERQEEERKKLMTSQVEAMAQDIMKEAAVSFDDTPAVEKPKSPEGQDELDAATTENEDSAPSALAIGKDGVKMMGYLERKPTMEGNKKKASSRVWRQFYGVLKDTDLIFYRDEMEAKERHEPIQTMSVVGSKVAVASDYHKKKNVLRLALTNGSEYLMQAGSADEMSLWIQNIRGSAVDPNNPPSQPSSPQRSGSVTSPKRTGSSASQVRPGSMVKTPEPIIDEPAAGQSDKKDSPTKEVKKEDPPKKEEPSKEKSKKEEKKEKKRGGLFSKKKKDKS